MAKVAPSHEEAKKLLQQKYFNVYDPTIPIFSFVGRITIQKGVHLILNSVRELHEKFNFTLLRLSVLEKTKSKY
mgnify:CR=1 FL=1